MQPDEIYRYDTLGYLVIENVIAPQLLTRLRECAGRLRTTAQRRLSGLPTGSEAEHISILSEERVTLDQLVHTDPAFLELVDHPAVMPYVRAMVPSPRLKSTWMTLTRRGGGIGGHGSHTPWVGYNSYAADRSGIAHNLFQALYALDDIKPGGGGLKVVPGSHKSQFPRPATVPADMIHEITMPAGSMAIFPHDIYHESCNQSDIERRIIIYTYCPGWIANSYVGGNRLYEKQFEQAENGSWRKYLLRPPHGFKDTYPEPAHQIAARAG